MESTFTAVFEKVDGGYIAYVEELPGANAQGATLEEARESLREAIALIIAANRELAASEQHGCEVVREVIKVVV